eukprot:SAG31_NODE_3285_length_4464_cov_2.238259_3_plen_381_part_00
MLLPLTALGIVLTGLSGSETGDELCLRTYRQDGISARQHNSIARALHRVGLCSRPPRVPCTTFSEYLRGVDIHVIEMSERSGRFRRQATSVFGVSTEQIHIVPATTPSSGACATFCPKLSEECIVQTDNYIGSPGAVDSYTKWPGYSEPPRPFKVTKVHVAVTISHIAAVQQACRMQKSTGNRMALVVEDDADLGALEHWPAALSQMVEELPSSWTIVNAAPSNNIGPFYSLQALREQRVFRGAIMNVTKHGFNIDYGAVGVLYNLANPDVCKHATSAEPETLITQQIQRCEVADMMIYRMFGGENFENVYAARMPLLYFARLDNWFEKSTAGNDKKNGGYDRMRWALAQRSAWATFARRREKLGFPRNKSCTNFDSPFA